MDRQVVGLVGKKQAGKDTLADALVYRFGAVKLGFGQLIVESLARVLAVPPEQITNDKEAYRRALQDWGGKMRRVSSEDVWIARLLGKIVHLPPQSRVVVTGVRLHSEADALRSLCEAKLVRIIRADVESDGDDDITETEQDAIKVDMEITSESAEETETARADEVAQLMGWDPV